MLDRYADVAVELHEHVAIVEICRPPHNFFDHHLIENLAQAFEALDDEAECRALVLAAEGKSFCAGAKFDATGRGGDRLDTKAIYSAAARLFACKKPVVAAIQGPAIGGGLGVALVADFRVASPQARFAANFVKLGIHAGFGITYTLPRLIGQQKASLMLYTGRRINGQRALEWGLVDKLTSQGGLREEAAGLAREIAVAAPLAVQATRATLREGTANAVRERMQIEFEKQNPLFQTEDHAEGVRAVAEWRAGNFKGR